MLSTNEQMQNGWDTSPAASNLQLSPMPKRRVMKLREDQSLHGFELDSECESPVAREGNQLAEACLITKQIGPEVCCVSRPLDIQEALASATSPNLSQESTLDPHSTTPLERLGLDGLETVLRSHQQAFQAFIRSQIDLLTSVIQTKLQNHSEQIDVLNSNLKDYSDNIMEVLQNTSFVSNVTPGASVQGVNEMARVTNIDDLAAEQAVLNGSMQLQRGDIDNLVAEQLARSMQLQQEQMHLLNVNVQKQNRLVDILTGSLHGDPDHLQEEFQKSTSPTDAGSIIYHDKSNGPSLSRHHTGITEISQPSASHHHLSEDQTNLFFAQELFGSTRDIRSMESRIWNTKMSLEHDEVAQSFMFMAWAIEPRRLSRFASVIKSREFDYCVCFVVALNAVFITIATDYACEHPNAATPLSITIMSIIFQALFTLELLAKLLVHRLYYFANKDRIWNCMDFALVLVGLFDIVASILDLDISLHGEYGNTQSSKWTILRTFRLLRIFRVARLFRAVRFFNELKVLLKVVVASLQSFFWCSLLLIIFMFMFSIMFVDGTALYLGREDQDANVRANLIENFSTVGTGIVSLMKAMTGGREWGPMADALQKVGSLYYICFLVFVAFTFLALMNVLTGLFVENTFKAASGDRDALAMDYLYESQLIVKDLILLYCAMTGSELDSGATIDCEQFETYMSSPVIRAHLAAIQLDIWDAEGFFHMLTSISNSKLLSLKDWVTGCMQMRGTGSSIAVNAVQADVQSLSKKIKRLERICTSSKHGNPHVYGSSTSQEERSRELRERERSRELTKCQQDEESPTNSIEVIDYGRDQGFLPHPQSETSM